MNFKTKLALGSAASILGISAVVGGTTFAFMSGNATNNSNLFQAGYLTLKSNRNDIPLDGPMFYTNYDPLQTTGGGVLNTGYWEPNDTHTRGMFIQNTGNITGVLTNLVAHPENASNQHVSSASSGADYTTWQNDMKFANEASVTIRVWERNAPDSTITASNFNQFLQDENTEYESDLAAAVQPPNYEHDWPSFEAYLEQLTNAGLAGYLDGKAYDLYQDGGPEITPVKVWSGALSDLVNNNSGLNVPAPLANLTLTPGDSMFVTYTIHIPDLGTVNNDINGLGDTYFGFESDFQQLDHNPSVG